MSTPRPRVTANFAITADGKTTTRRRVPTTFTSPQDKARLRAIRAAADAVLAGAATVAADAMSLGLGDPRLRAKRVAGGRPAEPLRVIVTNSGRLDLDWKVFANDRTPLVIFSATRPALAAQLPAFCDLHIFDAQAVPLTAALGILRSEYRVRRLVCEGGPRLLRALLELGVVDDLCATLLPRVFGGARAPTLTGAPGAWLTRPLNLQLARWQCVAGELHCHFARRKKMRRGVKDALTPLRRYG